MVIDEKKWGCPKHLKQITNCPEQCFNKKTCNLAKTKKNKCYYNSCKCNKKKCERGRERYKAQCKLGIISNDQNTLQIREGKCNNMDLEKVYKKPENFNNYYKYCKKKYLDNKSEKEVYDKSFNEAKWTFYTNYINTSDQLYRYYKNPKNSILTKRQLADANQYTVMWLRRYASSQGPTVDGWPATTLVGSNNRLFTNVHDGFSVNNSLKYARMKKFINKHYNKKLKYKQKNVHWKDCNIRKYLKQLKPGASKNNLLKLLARKCNNCSKRNCLTKTNYRGFFY